MKILITTPKLNKLAGVSSHFKGLKPFFSKDVFYFCIGAPKWRTIFAIYYVARFVITILFKRPEIIMVNPSMAKTAIRRDLRYLKIARRMGCKTAAMFHGFHTIEVEKKKKKIVEELNYCSVIFVLAMDFKKILLEWGVKVPIELTTTKVDDTLVSNYDAECPIGKIRRILFLSRITQQKGIYVALNVFKLLSNKYPQLEYVVVGDGSDLEKAKKYVVERSILNVTFKGGLSGPELSKAFQDANCYLFTSYHEGMPTSVLEAMAFGLPVITRPVGGLVDFFVNGKMGFFVDSDQEEDYIPCFEKLLSNENLTKEISIYNTKYAKDHFLASKIAPWMENVIQTYCDC